MNAIQQLLTEHVAIWTAAETEKKSGRGRGSSGARSVYGIKKLRELILELAVQGRLTPRSRPWKNLKLSDLGSWAIGSGFPTSEQGHQHEEILFAKVSDMNLDGNEKFILSTNNTISQVTANRLRINVHLSGTVIFPKIGGAIATNKRRVLTRPTAIDNNCLGLTPKNGVSSAWLYLLLSSIDLSKYQAGTSVPALAQGVLKDIPVMLPDEMEQDLVVAKVDELMALCDQLEAQHSNTADAHEQLITHLLGTLTQSQSAADFNTNWQRIAAHFDTLLTTEVSIDALKQTLLQLAVMGKLVAQDPTDQPATQLLEHIQNEKSRLISEGKIKKNISLARIEKHEYLFDLPMGWQWSRLGTIVEIRGGKRVSNGYQLLKQPTPYIYIRVSDMKDGSIDDSDLHYIDSEMREKISRYIITKDDIYMTIVGATIGKCGIVPEKFDQMNLTENAARLTPWIGIEKTYLYTCLSGSICQAQFLEKTKQVGVQKMALNRLSNTIIPLPPRNEQIRIVTKLEKLMNMCDQLRNRIDAASEQQKNLTDVLVRRAVMG